MGPDRHGIQVEIPADLSKVRISLDQNRLVATLEGLSSGSRRGPVAEVESVLAGRLVTKVGIPQDEAARLLKVITPAIARALKRPGKEYVYPVNNVIELLKGVPLPLRQSSAVAPSFVTVRSRPTGS